MRACLKRSRLRLWRRLDREQTRQPPHNIILEVGAGISPNINEYMTLFYAATAKVPESPYNSMTDVCLILVQKLGPERLLELFDNIEMVVNQSGLPNLIGSSQRKA